MPDNYIRVIFNRRKDKAILNWLIEGRTPFETPAHACKRKLYNLFAEDIKRREQQASEATKPNP